MSIELPFPAKALWPNGRAHWAAKHRATKKHREWAKNATLADSTRPALANHDHARIHVSIFVYPKTRNLIDSDNALAACKSYIDGVADALNVDDSRFVYHPITFGEPVKNGKIVIGIEVA